MSSAESLSFRPRLQWLILRTSIEERLVYRADFALGTLFRFLPIVTQIFLWAAIFQQREGHSERTAIAGYDFHSMWRLWAS